MKIKQSAIDNTVYMLDGLSVIRKDENGKVLSITTFASLEAAVKEFKRATQSYKHTNKNTWRKRKCATVYYNQLIIRL